MPRRKPAPIHPGEILLEEFLVPLGLSQYRLAKDISVPPRRINEIVRGQRSITADTALRLASFFQTTDRFWLNLQIRYDLELKRIDSGIGWIAKSRHWQRQADRFGSSGDVDRRTNRSGWGPGCPGPLPHRLTCGSASGDSTLRSKLAPDLHRLGTTEVPGCSSA